MSKIRYINTNKHYSPRYATEGSSGIDLAAAERIILTPGGTALVGTGVKVDFNGLTGLLFIRSGISVKKNLSLANGVGLIDPDYQGEIKLALYNRGNEKVIIEAGERIAQLMIMAPIKVDSEEVSSFTATARGEGGFGSTGT